MKIDYFHLWFICNRDLRISCFRKLANLTELNNFHRFKEYRCESDEKVLYLAGLWVGEGDFGLGGEINLVLPLESSRDCRDPTWRYQNHFSYFVFNLFYFLTTQGCIIRLGTLDGKCRLLSI